jgi:Leucine Rich repeat
MDAGLKQLKGLLQLTTLNLSGTAVTDAGLKHLSGLTQLQGLNLYGTKVTDAGLKELAGLKRLQTLELSYTQVTDAGVKELARLKSLQWLTLFGTKVTDAGLKELAGLRQLRVTRPDGENKMIAALYPNPEPTPQPPPAKDGWTKDPAAFARLYFGDNLEKRTPQEAGPVKGAPDVEKRVVGTAVEWEGQVLVDVVNKTGKKSLVVPFSKAGWIWVSERSLQDQIDARPLGSRVRVAMKLNAPIIPVIAGDGVPLIILGGDDARLTPLP